MLYKTLPKNQIIKNIEILRKEFFKNTKILNVDDFGAGSAKLQLQKIDRQISRIANISSTTPKYGNLYYRIANFLKPEIVIELGTCLGLGTMYLASGNETSKVFTIEGSTSLIQLAQKNFHSLNITNIVAEHGNFDTVLPCILNGNGKFDLMFIDGNHRKEAVLNYFYTSLPFASGNAIMIFDDIRWSEEMFEAWCEICRNECVKLSLDLFKIGIVFFRKKLRKQHLQLYY